MTEIQHFAMLYGLICTMATLLTAAINVVFFKPQRTLPKT